MLPALVHNCTNNFPQNGGKKNVKLPNAKGARGSSALPLLRNQATDRRAADLKTITIWSKDTVEGGFDVPDRNISFLQNLVRDDVRGRAPSASGGPGPGAPHLRPPDNPLASFPARLLRVSHLGRGTKEKKKSALPPVFFTLSPARRSRGKPLQSRRMKDDHDKRNQSINCHSFAVAIAQLYNKANLRYCEWGTDTKWALYQVLGHRAKTQP